MRDEGSSEVPAGYRILRLSGGMTPVKADFAAAARSFCPDSDGLKDNRACNRVSTFAQQGDQPDGRSRSVTAYEPIETASRDEITPADRAPALVPAARLRACRALPAQVRCARRASRRSADARRPAQVSLHDQGRLREGYPFAMFAVPREQVVRVHASSGTTGKPTVVGYTQNDIDMWATLMARSIHAAVADAATWCTSATVTACLPGVSARTTAPNGWAAR
jgi:hypothetical protein